MTSMRTLDQECSLPKLTINLTLNPGEDYAGNLERRLEEYGISKAELARELGVTPPELSRYFSKDPERRVQPRADNIVRIEQAVFEIRRKLRRARAKMRKQA